MIRLLLRVSFCLSVDARIGVTKCFTDLKFQEDTANVVHMSVKPQDFMEDEDAKGSKATRSQSHDGGEGRSPGCRCNVM